MMATAVEAWSPAPARRGQSLALDLPELLDLADRLADVEGFVPKALLGRPPAILATLLAGRELGLGPMESLRAIYVIEGRVSLSAEVARALVYAAGHELVIEAGDTRCTARGRRRDSSTWSTIEWTLDRARRAKLANRAVWQQYPRQMLSARATGELCHLVFPDALAGLDVHDDVEGDTVDEPPTPARKPRAARATVPAPELEAPGAETPPTLPPQPARSPETSRAAQPAPIRAATPPRATSGPPEPPLPGETDYPAPGVPSSTPTVVAPGAESLDLGELADNEPPLDALDLGDVPPEGDVDELAEPRTLSLTMRRLHARMSEVFTGADRALIDAYRHALVAIATRQQPDGPQTSSYALDDNYEAQMAVDAILNHVQAGRALIARNPSGTVELRVAGHLYRVTFSDPVVVEVTREP